MSGKSKRRDMSNAIEKAAGSQMDRFDQAAELLKTHPTGFTTAPAVAVPSINGSEALLADPIPPEQPSPAKLSDTAIHRMLQERYGRPTYEEWGVNDLLENPYGSRQIYTPERIEEVGQQLIADGQIVPAIAAARGNQRILIEGETRKRGARKFDIPVLKILTYENVSDRDLYLLSYKTNVQRSRQSALDDAISWRKLLQDGVFKTEEDIAESVGQSAATVNKTLATLQLQEPVLELIRSNPNKFGMSVLYELVLLQKVAQEPKIIELAERVLRGEVGRREISDIRSKLSEPKARRPKQTSRQYKINAAGSNRNISGVIKEWDNGRVTLDIELGDLKEQAKFIAELRQRFLADPAEPEQGM